MVSRTGKIVYIAGQFARDIDRTDVIDKSHLN
jgi:hypothetical protein